MVGQVNKDVGFKKDIRLRSSIKEITSENSDMRGRNWIGDNEYGILKYCLDNCFRQFTVKEVAEYLEVDSRRAYDAIQRLVSRGWVEKAKVRVKVIKDGKEEWILKPARGLYRLTVDPVEILSRYHVHRKSESMTGRIKKYLRNLKQKTAQKLEQLKLGIYQGKGQDSRVSCDGFWCGDVVRLGYVLGVLCGDGWVSGGRFGLNAVDRRFVEEFKSVLESLGFRVSRVYEVEPRKDGWSKYYRVDVNCSAFCKWFRSLSVNDIWVLIKDNNDAVREFVRGFYESEGSIDRKEFKVLSMFNTNKDLIYLVARILREFGFEPRVTVDCNRGERRKPLYRLRLHGKEQVKRFLWEFKPIIKNGGITSSCINRPVVSGWRFDNVRGYVGCRYVGGDRGRVLGWRDLSLFDSLSYLEVQRFVDNVGVLDGMLAIYTNWGQEGHGIRVEWRPPKGFVKRNGVAGSVRMFWEVVLTAWKALTVLLREAPLHILRKAVEFLRGTGVGKVLLDALKV